eukprot:4388392-Alexandrium_andersonii.AAC.1
MGDCGVQSAEARLAASVWAGSTAALKQALSVAPQGIERLVDGACLDMAPRDAQKVLRDLGISHGVVAMDMHAAVQVDAKQATITKQVCKVMCAQLESSMTTEQRARLRSCGGVGAGSYLEGPPDEG